MSALARFLAATRRFSPARSGSRGVFATHGATAFAPATRAHMRLAFAFLLGGFATPLLFLGAREIAFVLTLSFKFRGTRFAKRDGDCLAAAFHLSAFAAT